MESAFFFTAVILELIAAGGFIVFAVTKQNKIFKIFNIFLFFGFLCHTAFILLYYPKLEATPGVDLKSAFAVLSWSIVCAYFILQIKFRLMVLAPIVVPVVALIMLFAYFLPWVTEETFSQNFFNLWIGLHIASVFMGEGLFIIAFLVGIMYLFQERAIKLKKLGAIYKRLPSLEVLDKVNHSSVLWGFPFLTIGIICGVVYAQATFGAYWQWDPKEVWTLVTWIAYAVLIHKRVLSGWHGRKAAILSIICFGMLLFTFFGVNLLLGGYHGFAERSSIIQ